MRGYRMKCIRYRWLIVLTIIFSIECYFNVLMYIENGNTIKSNAWPSVTRNLSACTLPDFSLFILNVSVVGFETTVLPQDTTKELVIVYYKYPLVNSTEISMDYNDEYNSSYYWFMSLKHHFKNIATEDRPIYSKDTPLCQLNEASLGPINVSKTERILEWVEQQNPDVKLGGHFAPAHCRSKHRVAVIVPYRDRRINLIIFLHYIHPLLKKQLLDYRIFVIEQYGIEKFNKGTLYNIAFLETQRFGSWDCLIFHDVDLIPEDERISYSCPIHPTHMASSVEMYNYELPYSEIFGGVTALTTAQYETVNGYSNCYWNWGGEDDDIHRRILAKNYTVLRYNSSIARYATLPHPWNDCGNERKLFLMLSRLRFSKEGLPTTKYKLINVTEEKLYTHLLADVNPTKMRLDSKSLMNHIINFNGKSLEYGRQELQLRGISAKALRRYLRQQPSKNENDITTTNNKIY